MADRCHWPEAQMPKNCIVKKLKHTADLTKHLELNPRGWEQTQLCAAQRVNNQS